jgi:hypothetical protein
MLGKITKRRHFYFINQPPQIQLGNKLTSLGRQQNASSASNLLQQHKNMNAKN